MLIEIAVHQTPQPQNTENLETEVKKIWRFQQKSGHWSTGRQNQVNTGANQIHHSAISAILKTWVTKMRETGNENLIWHMSSIYGYGLCFQRTDGWT